MVVLTIQMPICAITAVPGACYQLVYGQGAWRQGTGGCVTDHEVELQTLIFLLRGIPSSSEQRLVFPLAVIRPLGHACC